MSDWDAARLRRQYSLDPDVVYLNHGSFGAVPLSVQRTFSDWHRQMEANPVLFMSQTAPQAMVHSRAALARFVGTTADNLAFVVNATQGINAIARSLDLAPGDEVLATNQEYGATQKAFIHRCQQAGARYVVQDAPFPVADREDWLDAFWQGVTPRTRVLFFSHITAPTALILPLPEICRRARAEGLITVADGAHAPGQIDLALDAWDVDFYTGNCHKWLSSPRGCGFIFAHPRHHDLIEPLIVGHGWEPGARSAEPLQDYYAWPGTADPCAALSVPAAIEYLERLPWAAIRPLLHARAAACRRQLADLFDCDVLCPDDQGWWSQMFTARLPQGAAEALGSRLWEKHNIIAPVMRLPQCDAVRVSIKEYNSSADCQALVDALAQELL